MHLTDDQLNEYLDNETTERVQIEMHLSSCDECAARLTALQALFTEIESLPELTLSKNLSENYAQGGVPAAEDGDGSIFRMDTKSIAARFAPTPSLPSQLPRWLTLTATLQAAFAVIAIVFVAPFLTNLLPAIQMPSFTETAIRLQSQWIALLDTFTNYQLPTLPQLPAIEISSLVLALTLTGVSILWLVGNGLLLRRQIR